MLDSYTWMMTIVQGAFSKDFITCSQEELGVGFMENCTSAMLTMCLVI